MSARGHLYWSLRRELWENRSVYVAPPAVAAVVVLGFAINASPLMEKMRNLAALEPAKQVAMAVVPFSVAASLVLVTGWFVAVFYCLDALNAERRDRSILFWKSMPVSDATTVAAKLAVVALIVPAVSVAVALATQALMLAVSAAVLAAKGVAPATLWSALPLSGMTLVMLYGVAVHVLWFAPIYGWLLMVSAWARRAVFAWAFLPFFAASAAETVAFGTQYIAAFLKGRIVGGMALAFTPGSLQSPITELSQLTPGRFLGSLGLWLGLVFAALCIVATVQLRRYRDPN